MVELNENQLKAIKHKDGPMLVFSGPGSGKTTVITQRLIYMVENYGINPRDILTITFTKAAAEEMESRYISAGGKKGVMFSTFHALFFRILRSCFGYTVDMIISENEKREFLSRMVESYDIETDDINQTVDVFLMNAGLIKNNLSNMSEFQPRDMSKEEFKALFRIYEEHKERNEKIDFDDMMYGCYNLLKNDNNLLEKWRSRYKYILIDEFQDINRAQYECVKMLAIPENNVFAVGDDDQSIYSFRGASPGFMKEFVENYKNCKQILLDINYRSTDKIIGLSERIIAKNKMRFPKTIKGTGRTGIQPTLFFCNTPGNEADRIVDTICKLHDEEGIPYRDMAIIYRNNITANSYARRFVKRGIPYFLKDNTYDIYDHWIAKDFCAYADFIADITADEAFERIANKPARHISKKAIEDGKKLGMSTFYGVMNSDLISSKGSQMIHNLYNDIQLARKLNGKKQAQYIYKFLEYEKYLDSYAAYKKCSSVFLKQIACEIMDIAAETNDLRELRGLIEEYKMTTSNIPVPKRGDDAVTLTTMHSSKGLEFGTVFIPSIVDTVIPHGNPKADFEMEEERRLFYVAVTRAKDRLYMSTFSSIGTKKAKISGFLTELGIKKPENNIRKKNSK